MVDQDRIDKIDFIISLFSDVDSTDSEDIENWRRWSCAVLELDPDMAVEDILKKSLKDKVTAQTSGKFGL